MISKYGTEISTKRLSLSEMEVTLKSLLSRVRAETRSDDTRREVAENAIVEALRGIAIVRSHPRMTKVLQADLP